MEFARCEQVTSLDEYEQKFSTMFENVSLASVILSDSWRLKFVNAHFCALTGYTKEEILYGDWVDLFTPSDKKEKTKNTNELISLGLIDVAPVIEQEIVSKTGQKLLFKWNNAVIKDTAGTFLGVSCTGQARPFPENKTVLAQPAVANPPAAENIQQTTESWDILKDYDTFTGDFPTSGPSGNITVEDLEFVKVLNNLGGDRGSVQLAFHKDTKAKVAVKVLKKELMNKDEIERARREIQIMEQLTKLNNPYIIKLIGWDETTTHFNLIVEYVCGGELTSLILKRNGLPEKECQQMFQQLLSAIQCCHQHHIIHRDIKLQNILLDSRNNIKLIDFGLSNFVENGQLRATFCGTPAYASPEILTGVQYKGPEVDIWSLGIVLYSMLTARFPFTTVGDILKGKFSCPEHVSQECADLLVVMLQVKKEIRATLADVINHPWLKMSFEDSPATLKRTLEVKDEPDLKRPKNLLGLPISSTPFCVHVSLD